MKRGFYLHNLEHGGVVLSVAVLGLLLAIVTGCIFVATKPIECRA